MNKANIERKMEEYCIKEKEGENAQLLMKGNPLVSINRTAPCKMVVTFHNRNIDLINQYCHAEEQFGEEYSVAVSCNSEEDLPTCMKRFMDLMVDGFTSDIRGLIGLDGIDVEKACYSAPQGRYLRTAVSRTTFESSFETFCKDVTSLYECSKHLIIVGEGIYQSELHKLVSNVDISDVLIQEFITEDMENVTLDIWIFP